MDKQPKKDPTTSSFRPLSRRSFVGVGAAAAVTATAALTGCVRQTVDDADVSEADGATTGTQGIAANDTYTPSFLQIPDAIPESSLKSTITTSVVIVGAGLSGLCAARAASEAGVKDILVIEKGESFQCRSNQFAVVGGAAQERLRISIDKNALVGELMRASGYRANQRILKQWADHSGEAFNWFLEPCRDAGLELEDESAVYDGNSLSVRQLHWPHPEKSKTENNYLPIFDTDAVTLPDMKPYLEKTYDICIERGVQFKFSSWVRQLIRTDDSSAVTGVVFEDLTGAYHKVSAGKAVLLATGDYGSNAEMRSYYTPWATRFTSAFPNVDAKDEPTNTGDGQRMGMWIGAKMEAGPHASMVVNTGGPLGVDAFLLVDANGKRFTNEDVGGQAIQNQLSRLPQKTAWQIFDAKWADQIGSMDAGFANVNWYKENAHDVPNGRYIKNAFIANESSEDGNTPGFASFFEEDADGVQADSIEDLAKLMDVNAKTLTETIERYNQLAEAGNDDDFGKRADRLFPISEPPFYAYKFTDTVLLASFGGLATNTDFQVLDTNDNAIEGLYAVGNAQGGRILVDYPTAAPGISHGMALTHGMLAGWVLAEI